MFCLWKVLLCQPDGVCHLRNGSWTKPEFVVLAGLWGDMSAAFRRTPAALGVAVWHVMRTDHAHWIPVITGTCMCEVLGA